jgi:fumarate reductase (CoM/CoB) subunit B
MPISSGDTSSAAPAAPSVGFLDGRSLGQAEQHDTLAARNTRLAPGDPVRIKVRRSEPQAGHDAYQPFEVPYQKWMRVLDALNWIADNAAPDLAFRWFCGSKMCGTCAVRMNGREVLACWEAVEPEMVIEPLRNLPVIRDLVIDRSSYEEKVAQLQPWIERREPYPGFPEPLTHRQMKDASSALDCISCMCCYSACPVIGLGDLTDFAGPAPLVQLGQTALDPRNDPEKVRRSLELTGIFNCVSCYKCEEVCPAHIPIVSQIIEPLKAKAARLAPEMARHSFALREVVARRGRVDPGELVLRVQGLRALSKLRRIWRLFARGKIDPIRTLFSIKTAAAEAAGRILAKGAGKK